MFLLALQQARVKRRVIRAVAGILDAARQRLHAGIEFAALDLQARQHHRKTVLRRRNLQSFLQHTHRLVLLPGIEQHAGKA